MSILSSRAAQWIVPIWLIVVGLIGLLGIPLTSATSVLLISVGFVAPAIMLSFWNDLPRSPSFATKLHWCQEQPRPSAVIAAFSGHAVRHSVIATRSGVQREVHGSARRCWCSQGRKTALLATRALSDAARRSSRCCFYLAASTRGASCSSNRVPWLVAFRARSSSTDSVTISLNPSPYEAVR